VKMLANTFVHGVKLLIFWLLNAKKKKKKKKTKKTKSSCWSYYTDINMLVVQSK
jgi:hypothetical protein